MIGAANFSYTRTIFHLDLRAHKKVLSVFFTLPTFKQKLERSVSELTDENQKQHCRVLAALKDIRIYRKTLNQDQLKA